MVTIAIVLALTIPITAFVMGFSLYKSTELLLNKFQMQPKTEEKSDLELSEIKIQPKEAPKELDDMQDVLNEWLNGPKDKE